MRCAMSPTPSPAPAHCSRRSPNWSARPCSLLLLKRVGAALEDTEDTVVVGTPSDDQRTGLWLCARNSTPFGPGTGRYADLDEWYLPLRGREASLGAALVTLPDAGRVDPASRTQAQALCDQMGLALQRALTERAAQASRASRRRAQGVRNAMLAAISHDYRTPLATIMGAASSLAEQGDRLDRDQRQRLARTIVEESAQLAALTDNTLQLARLDAPGVQLRCDWESAEEIVGAVLRRCAAPRPRRAACRPASSPGCRCVRCDAMLLAQMLDNLVDNALKYSDAPSAGRDAGATAAGARGALPCAIAARALRRRGASAIFEVFQRGDDGRRASPAPAARRGAGVGLAVCRAIARAHGGELRLRARGHGGSSFECWLPVSRAAARRAGSGRRGVQVTLRVLLVEDDRELRATLREALARRRLRGATPRPACARACCCSTHVAQRSGRCRRRGATWSCSTSACPTATARPC